MIALNEDIAERFLKATFRGWIHCLDNFDECVESLVGTPFEGQLAD